MDVDSAFNWSKEWSLPLNVEKCVRNNNNNALFLTTARQSQMGPISFYKRVYCRANKHEDGGFNEQVGGVRIGVCRDIARREYRLTRCEICRPTMSMSGNR